MGSKRPREDDTSAAISLKKPRSGFNVGPDNLPDGTWRRKVIKIKHDLVHKAKVKKEYAKIKAREGPLDKPIRAASPISEVTTQELHPDRQAMLDAPREASPPIDTSNPNPFPGSRSRDRRKSQKPGYFAKETAIAEKNKEEARLREEEYERRTRERKVKLEERDKFRRAMAKARTGGKNGQRKLGRESTVLLERVKRMVAE